jgi:hypothetical protein
MKYPTWVQGKINWVPNGYNKPPCTRSAGFFHLLTGGKMAQQVIGIICTRPDMSGFRELNGWWSKKEPSRDNQLGGNKEPYTRRIPKEGNKITITIHPRINRQIPYPNENVPILISPSLSRRNQANAQTDPGAYPTTSPKSYRDGKSRE